MRVKCFRIGKESTSTSLWIHTRPTQRASSSTRACSNSASTRGRLTRSSQPSSRSGRHSSHDQGVGGETSTPAQHAPSSGRLDREPARGSAPALLRAVLRTQGSPATGGGGHTGDEAGGSWSPSVDVQVGEPTSGVHIRTDGWAGLQKILQGNFSHAYPPTAQPGCEHPAPC